jgi:hypothetical protein
MRVFRRTMSYSSTCHLEPECIDLLVLAEKPVRTEVNRLVPQPDGAGHPTTLSAAS